MLVWLDLETTGLDPQKEQILEVACIVTTDELDEVARFERVIYSLIADIVIPCLLWLDPDGAEDNEKRRAREYAFQSSTGVNPYVGRMHRDNGLWEQVRHGQALATVDDDLAKFLSEHAVKEVEYVDEKTGETKTRTDRPQLAGNTISFDRGFIAAHMPKTLAELHYRNLDVSSFNEAGRRFWPEVYKSRPRNSTAAHRGMADIEESIRVFKHYLERLAPVPQPVYTPADAVCGTWGMQ